MLPLQLLLFRYLAFFIALSKVITLPTIPIAILAIAKRSSLLLAIAFKSVKERHTYGKQYRKEIPKKIDNTDTKKEAKK